jgi:hypothetical protein
VIDLFDLFRIAAVLIGQNQRRQDGKAGFAAALALQKKEAGRRGGLILDKPETLRLQAGIRQVADDLRKPLRPVHEGKFAAPACQIGGGGRDVVQAA